MKQMFRSQATPRRTAQAIDRNAPGAKAVSLTPPPYGIDVVDRHSTSLENKTGLPDGLKDGIERLSGLAMSDVRVHRDSPKPAGLHALAYTQGTEIHVAPGQEHHLAHEAWHAVQQKQGRVQANAERGGVALNDDAGLEREADVMGAQAAGLDISGIQGGNAPGGTSAPVASSPAVVQRQPAPPYVSLHSKVDPSQMITEGRWAKVGRGGTVAFTAVSAGCLAITAVFEGGGGVGLHMALNMPNRGQWNQFRDAVAGKKVATIYLDSDMLSQDDGWHVKLHPDNYTNETEYSPRSAQELQVEFGQDYGANGWMNASRMIQSWFQEAFGAAQVIATETNGVVVHHV